MILKTRCGQNRSLNMGPKVARIPIAKPKRSAWTFETSCGCHVEKYMRSPGFKIISVWGIPGEG